MVEIVTEFAFYNFRYISYFYNNDITCIGFKHELSHGFFGCNDEFVAELPMQIISVLYLDIMINSKQVEKYIRVAF